MQPIQKGVLGEAGRMAAGKGVAGMVCAWRGAQNASAVGGWGAWPGGGAVECWILSDSDSDLF